MGKQIMDAEQRAQDKQLYRDWRREIQRERRRARVITCLVVLGGFGMGAYLFAVITGSLP